MKAGETTFLRFLEGKNQFVIPIFQRTYSWKETQCRQLWDDIIRISEEEGSGLGHFIGSIVYIEDGPQVIGGVPQLLVIDGQQRLTTIILLLAALGKHISENQVSSEISLEKINDYYIFNSHEKGEMRYKLILTQSDKETLNHLIDGKELPDKASVRLKENYTFFENQIKKCRLDNDSIFRGIERLFIVSISLDRISDDPQLIFESLNSTGMDLSQADLIRNYVLMGLNKEDQEAMYKDYWHPMEQNLASHEYENLLDMFVRDYVTAKIGRIPNINEIYFAFKNYAIRQNLPMKEIIADVYKFSRYYAWMALQKAEDKAIKSAIEDINELEMYVSYPFLLLMYDDYANGKISKDDFIDVLRTVESYVFRRYICGIPTNSLNKTFATLYRDIDHNNYMESLKFELLSKDSYRRFPRDEEFVKEFLVKDIYHTRNCKYILQKLENLDHKEKISISDYTIEHIMPQNDNLSDEWQKELGTNWKEIQTKYLHTIGNLTLTGYNPELSDSSFIKKRDMEKGFKDSHLILNHKIADLDHWNEDQIRERANDLVNLTLKVWKLPTVSIPIDPIGSTNISNIDVNKIIQKVFPLGEDYQAARSLIKDIFNTVDYENVKRILTVSCNESGSISLVMGQWKILKFVKYADSIHVGFCIDFDVYTENTIKFSEIEDFSSRYTGTRKIKLAWLPWSHETVLPQKFIEAWHEAIKYAYNQFKDWDSSSNRIYHKPALVEVLINSK